MESPSRRLWFYKRDLCEGSDRRLWLYVPHVLVLGRDGRTVTLTLVTWLAWPAYAAWWLAHAAVLVWGLLLLKRLCDG